MTKSTGKLKYKPRIPVKDQAAALERGNKICSTCRVEKSKYQFTGRETRCGNCCVIRASEYNRRKKTGWTDAEYQKALIEQENVCAICGGVNSDGRALAADHCHASMNKRGLLCYNCNLILGKALDSSELLRRAADYLDAHSASNKLEAV